MDGHTEHGTRNTEDTLQYYIGWVPLWIFFLEEREEKEVGDKNREEEESALR